jgi:protoporphyrinogen oxidase
MIAPLDVLVVGGGPAGLATAIRLKQQLAAAGTNILPNPSGETNVTGYSHSANAEVSQSTAGAVYGSYSFEYARTGAAVASEAVAGTDTGCEARIFPV